MQCPTCQQENAENLKFCGHCGSRLSRVKPCLKCGFENPHFHKFCGECGGGLDAPAAQSAAPGVSTAGPHPVTLPSQPTEDLPTPSRLSDRQRGERRQVAVLFADVVGFTSMSERMDPERVTDIMNQCFERLEKTIRRYDGTVDKYMGDAVMAIFGAPVSHENDVELSVRAALGMLDDLKEVNRSLDVPLNLSIGITAGEVIAGEVGGAESKAYTVMGDTVNTAQRLESSAAPGEILVSATVERATRHLFRFDARPPIKLKGKAEPVPVFAALGALESAATTETAIPPLIGRQREWDMLRGWVETAVTEKKGRLAAVLGEAGIGKSRLKHELKIWLKERHLSFYEGRASRAGESISYAPFIDILRAMFEIPPDAAKVAVRDCVRAKSEAMGLHPVEMQALGQIFSVEFEDATFGQLDAKGRKTSTFIAVRKVVSHILAEGPLVLIFEDLQGADSLSVELIEFLMPLVEAHPLVLLCLYRPSFTHAWDRHEFYQRIFLKELAPADADALAEHYAQAKLPHEVRVMLREKTQGNPLYIEEVMRTLIEEEPGFASGTAQEMQRLIARRIPTSVQGIIAARMDRLSPEVKFALQTAAVAGKTFSYDLMLRLMPMRDALDSWLAVLTERGFVYERLEGGEREFVFKHNFIQEVAYRMLLQKHRAELHRSIAQAIEDIYKDKIEEFYERLAYHHQEGGQLDRAASYWLLAARRARVNFDNERAVEHYHKALALIEVEADQKTPEWNKRCTEAYLGRALAHRLLGRYDDASRDLERATTHARTAGDPSLLVDVLNRHAGIYYFMGAYNQAIVLGQQAMSEAERISDRLGVARSHRNVGIAYYGLGDSPRAKEHLEKARAIFEDTNNKTELAMVLGYLGVLFTDNGDYMEALACLTESLVILDEMQDKLQLASCYNNLGSLHRYLENFQDATENFEESHALSIETGSVYGIVKNLVDMGELYIAMNELDQAEPALEEALRMAREHNQKSLIADAMVLYGIARARRGDRSAVNDVLEGVQIAESIPKPTTTLYANFYMAGLFLDWGEREKARKTYEEAVALAQKIRMLYYEKKGREILAGLDAPAAAVAGAKG